MTTKGNPPSPPRWIRVEQLDVGYLVMAGTGDTFAGPNGTQERVLRVSCATRVEVQDALMDWFNAHSDLRAV